MSLPALPAPLERFIPYLNGATSVHEALKPYLEYEQGIRKLYAQDPENHILKDPLLNLVPLFAGHESLLTAHSRDVSSESQEEADKYLMPLLKNDRKKTGEPSTVKSFEEFAYNFNLFSESSLADLDWNNVVVAGSAAVTPLLPVRSPHNLSKRALRTYYHEILAPASDVDIFIYGLDEAQAMEKIKRIEAKIRDSILEETTTVRTKNAITIASRYPTRHVQIVLRLYKSVSEILTGFDVDCSCVAYDGNQVYATPRAVAAFMTQINTVDLSRRSPSYENRLSKYSRRGFEVLWPELDRSRIDTSIFERAFTRVLGLARLLVLEKLPGPQDRDQYRIKRRYERGRPSVPSQAIEELPGNIKSQQPDDIAEWVEESDFSSYHTFTIPYGPSYSAKRIEKLLFTKDLLLNAEWNRPKDRKTQLHRHPAFVGLAEDTMQDCCGFCPEPLDEEDKQIAETESKHYIKGMIQFTKDDPRRQEIGSFHPVTDTDWTEMAYLGNTTRLCQAIVDRDLDHVEDWCRGQDADVNCRDHTGRTPLQLAAMCSTTEIVKCLINHGARLISRTTEGFTALHFAAQRGNVGITTALLEKSESNQAEGDEADAKRKNEDSSLTNTSNALAADRDAVEDFSDADVDMMEDHESIGSEDMDDITEGSYLRVKRSAGQIEEPNLDTEGADVYEIDLVAWDYAISPLHLAIMGGHLEVVRLLVDQFGADVLLPAKAKVYFVQNSDGVVMTPVMAAQQPEINMVREVLAHGASSSQADANEKTALFYLAMENRLEALDILMVYDRPAAESALNHLAMDGNQFFPEPRSPLQATIHDRKSEMSLKLLELGAKPEVDFDSYSHAYSRKFTKDSDINEIFQRTLTQPIVLAALQDMPTVVLKLIEKGANVNTLTRGANALLAANSGMPKYGYQRECIGSVLDIVRYRRRVLQHELQTVLLPKTKSPPEPLNSDQEMLKGLDTSSYVYWLVKTDISSAKLLHGQMNAQYNAKTSTDEEYKLSALEKEKALEDALSSYELLEQQLLKLNAKQIDELHPDVKPIFDFVDNPHGTDKAKEGPYCPSPKFYLVGHYQPLGEVYLELFEATWRGDIKRVRAMTLAPWSTNGDSSVSSEHRPLTIACQDARGFTPFAIAVVNGHYDLASTIVEIATVQYKPPEGESNYRYTLDTSGGEYSDTSSAQNDDELPLFSHLVSDQVTIQDISALANSVSSHTSPLEMICSHCEVWRLFPTVAAAKEMGVQIPYFDRELVHHGTREKLYSQAHVSRVMNYVTRTVNGIHTSTEQLGYSLIKYATTRNDLKMLRFMIQTSIQLTRSRDVGRYSRKHLTISEEEFAYAAKLGRVEVLSEMLSTTGAQIPLQEIAKSSGLEIKYKPEYYQALTVHGKKRQDWAARTRRVAVNKPIEDEMPPLIRASLQNNVDTTEFFFGESPLRRYEEYIANHKDDPAVETLLHSEGGVTKLLQTWLGSRRELAIHAAVMGRPQEHEDNSQLQFLLKQLPESIDAKTRRGRTPLHLAYKYARYSSAKYLLESGADPLICDKAGENVLHYYLASARMRPDMLNEVLAAFLHLTDKETTCQLLLKRSAHDHNAHTPLSLFLRANSGGAGSRLIAIETLFRFSEGKDLEIMDATGDYPLHYVVRRGMIEEAKLFIKHNPRCLHLENAVGMTPIDIANGAVLRTRIVPPPTLRTTQYGIFDGLPERLNCDARVLDIPFKEQTRATDMRTVLQRLANASPETRKLVSVEDANDVAKRLASMERHIIGHGQAHIDDEMDRWHEEAECFKNWDVIRLQRKTV